MKPAATLRTLVVLVLAAVFAPALGFAQCTIECAASVPTTAQVNVTVSVQASATLTDCSQPPSFQWDFGDGSAMSTRQYATHTYTDVGSYKWALKVSSDDAQCVKRGTIDITQTGSTDYAYVIPAVAHAKGAAGTDWRTDVVAVNDSDALATINLTFVNADSGATVTRTRSLRSGATAQWSDVIPGIFEISNNAKGTVLVASSMPLLLLARTYNQESAARTYGQLIPALDAGEGITAGQVGVIPFLKKTSQFRTNIGFVNLGTELCTVLVHLHDTTGLLIGNARAFDVPAGEWVQYNDVFATMDTPAQELAYATVEVTTTGGRAWAYASLVDEGSGDPTTIPVMVP